VVLVVAAAAAVVVAAVVVVSVRLPCSMELTLVWRPRCVRARAWTCDRASVAARVERHECTLPSWPCPCVWFDCVVPSQAVPGDAAWQEMSAVPLVTPKSVRIESEKG
jgi:hypothetical protein